MPKKMLLVVGICCLVVSMNAVALSAPHQHGQGQTQGMPADEQMMTSQQMADMSKQEMMTMCKDQMMQMMHKMMNHRMMKMMTEDQMNAVTEKMMGLHKVGDAVKAVGDKEQWQGMTKEQWMMNMHKIMGNLDNAHLMMVSDVLMETMTKDQMMMMHNMHIMMKDKMAACMSM